MFPSFLLCEFFDEGTNETMHSSVVCVTLVSVAVEFIAHDHSPMCLVTVSLGLQEALPFKLSVLLFSLTHTEILYYFLFMRSIMI